MPLVLENLYLNWSGSNSWMQLYYVILWFLPASYFHLLIFFFLKRTTDFQCISSVGCLRSTPCYTLCFLLEVFPRLPVLSSCFSLNFLLEQPSVAMGSHKHSGSFMLESFLLWVRGIKLFSLSLQWSQELAIPTCCAQALGDAGSRHELHRSAGCFNALWMGCLGQDAGPGMLLAQDSGNIFTWLTASSVYCLRKLLHG